MILKSTTLVLEEDHMRNYRFRNKLVLKKFYEEATNKLTKVDKVRPSNKVLNEASTSYRSHFMSL